MVKNMPVAGNQAVNLCCNRQIDEFVIAGIFQNPGSTGNCMPMHNAKRDDFFIHQKVHICRCQFEFWVGKHPLVFIQYLIVKLEADGPFDPRRMNAIDRQELSDVPEGTVLQVYRSGYEWNGEVFRTAQVKVACAPTGKQDE